MTPTTTTIFDDITPAALTDSLWELVSGLPEVNAAAEADQAGAEHRDRAADLAAHRADLVRRRDEHQALAGDLIARGDVPGAQREKAAARALEGQIADIDALADTIRREVLPLAEAERLRAKKLADVAITAASAHYLDEVRAGILGRLLHAIDLDEAASKAMHRIYREHGTGRAPAVRLLPARLHADPLELRLLRNETRRELDALRAEAVTATGG